MICDIKVGYSCNNACVHCVIAANKEDLQMNNIPIDLKTDECLNLISQAHSSGARKVVLTGGEPTIRKDFSELLVACHKLGLAVAIQTNGRLLGETSLCDDLDIWKQDTFVIALHGPNADIHDAITRRPGSFSATMHALSLLRERQYSTVGKVVISRLNAPYLLEILNCFHRMDVRIINFAFPHALGFDSDTFDLVVPRYSDLREVFYQLIDESQLSLEAVPFCIIPNHPEVISELHYLNQEQCFFTPVHDNTRNWTRERHEIKRKSTNCHDCSLFMICEGPWMEYMEKFGPDEFVPLDFDPIMVSKIFSSVLI
jgi:MoaA/NifB/PqqE/SkfB family radical SAM enzyme